MSNIVFILGAGASKDAGVPLMDNFLDVAQSLLVEGKLEPQSQQEFELVFQTLGKLQRIYAKGNLRLTNIEDVFAAFEMGALLKKIPGMDPDETSKPLLAMQKLIVHTIEKTLLIPVAGTEGETVKLDYPRSYGHFAKLVQRMFQGGSQRNNVAVITFNYDLALDVSFSLLNLPYSYFLTDAAEPQRVPLLKLHGSTNWGVCEQCTQETKFDAIRAVDLREHLGAFRAKDLANQGQVELRIGSRLQQIQHITHHNYKTGPVLVPPTWNKSGGHQNLAVVWQKAASVLSNADELYICGYSFPESDAFFHYLYALGSEGDRPFRRIRLIDPFWNDDMKRRYARLFGAGAQPRIRVLPGYGFEHLGTSWDGFRDDKVGIAW